MQAQPRRLAAIGECMLEMSRNSDTLFKLGFAGDVYNMSVYFARCAKDHARVDFMSAVGSDRYSERLLDEMRNQRVGAEHVRILQGRMSGLYLVENDAAGERDFYYYRSDAAARDMFEGDLGDALLANLLDYEYVYFSGITLAILKKESRDKFLAQLAELKQKNKVICFDSNYRQRLWDSKEQAQAYYNKVLPLIDIALLSVADAAALYDDCGFDACVERYLEAGAQKVIATAAEHGYMLATTKLRQRTEVEPVKVVDATGAGDAFNGAFLAALICGERDEIACQKAAALARKVIQAKGAIVGPC